jgi:hypothetical protein
MKMSAAAFDDLKAMLRGAGLLDSTQTVAREYQKQGFSAKRYRWDQFYGLTYYDRDDWFTRHAIYDSLDDTHIDTALRQIFPASW